MGPDGHVPHLTKFIYSLGQSGESVVGVGLGLLLIYYNQALGMPASLASIALGVAVVWDAFVDPSVGSWSDGLQSKRWGRRHLSMLSSIAPLGVCFFFLLWPPAGLGKYGLFVWLTVFSIATRTALSFFAVPFLSLGAELSQDYRERTRIVAVRLFIGMASVLLMLGVTWGYFFAKSPGVPDPQLVRGNYFWFALFGAATMVVLLVIATLGTMKTIPHLAGSAQKPKQFGSKRVFSDMLEALRSPSYRALFFGTLIFAIYSGTQTALSVHLQTFFWQLDPRGIRITQQSLPIGAMFGVLLSGQFTRIFDKKWTVIIGVVGASIFGSVPVLLRVMGLFPFHGDLLIWLLAAMGFLVAFLGIQAAVAVGSMMGDIADEHELRHGTRQEGIYFGAYSFSGKLTSGFSIVIAGMIIDLVGLKPDSIPGHVPAPVLAHFGLVYAGMALVQIVSTWVFLPYSLNSKRHAEVIAELQLRKTDASEANETASEPDPPLGLVPSPTGGD